MRLFIAEKPSVARALAAELGGGRPADGYIDCGADRVAWCFGHILEMAKPDHYHPDYAKWRAEDLPIIPERWDLLPKEDAKKQLAVIGRLLKEADEIVNAGDPDREGQLLIDEVLEHFGNRKPVLRFWVSAQDSVSLKRGLAALKDNQDYAGFRDAALARGRADWLIGMNFSRAFTLRARRGGSDSLLTVGRVQTPTLALVVARDREIEAFVPIPYHLLYAEIEHPNGAFRAKWEPGEDQAGLDAEGRLVDTAVADALIHRLSGQPGIISSYKQEPKREGPPRVYSLSSLTLAASNKFGFGAEEVLKACQSLYETHKLASYPRTDCDYLPESQHADAPRVLAALKQANPHLGNLIAGANPALKSKTWNDQKITAHHGIIPTQHEGNLSALSDTERPVYELIVRAYLAQFYPDHEYLSSAVTAEIEGEAFSATGKTVTRNGWREVYQTGEDDDDKGETQNLPIMAEGNDVDCTSVERKDLKTKPPARFTEGTLQAAMENMHKYVSDPEHRKALKEGDGIGTPATRAAIISEMKRRGFLEPKGKQIISTELGRGLIDALPEAVKSPVLTAQYERMLKEIEQGKAGIEDFLAGQAAFVREQVESANQGWAAVAGSGPACPQCGEGILRRIKRKDGRFFWGCSRFREGCKASYDDNKGKPALARKEAPAPSVLHQCLACGKGLIRRSGKNKGEYWWGCSGYPECRQTYPDLKGKPDYSRKPKLANV